MGKEKLNHNSAKTALSQIDTTFYGKLLLDTIDLQLTTGGAIEDIIQLLDEIVEELNFAQEEANEKNATDSRHCQTQGTIYTNEVATANNKINAAHVQIDDVLEPHKK
jgi:hypothetical protein